MKKFGFMLMAAAVLAMSFTSCEKKNDGDDIIGPQDGDEVKLPTVEATAGAVTLVIKFDVAPCDGYDILFVGDYGEIETAWNFGAAKKFTAIGEGWYKIVLKPNADGNISGRPIQGKDGDAAWDQDWSHSGEDIVALKNVGENNIKDSGYGEVNLSFGEADATDALVAFIQCKKWNLMPCAEKPKYNVTVIVPEFCGEELPIELIGGFNNWADEGTVALTKVEGNTYKAEVEAMEGQEWKVRGVGTWDVEIQIYRTEDNPDTPDEDEADTWGGVPNNKFGADLNVTVDYSDATKYRWNVCGEAAE